MFSPSAQSEERVATESGSETKGAAEVARGVEEPEGMPEVEGTGAVLREAEVDVDSEGVPPVPEAGFLTLDVV